MSNSSTFQLTGTHSGSSNVLNLTLQAVDLFYALIPEVQALEPTGDLLGFAAVAGLARKLS